MRTEQQRRIEEKIVGRKSGWDGRGESTLKVFVVVVLVTMGDSQTRPRECVERGETPFGIHRKTGIAIYCTKKYY